MIFFNDPFSQAQAQAPAAFFAGSTGNKDFLEQRFRHSHPLIGNMNVGFSFLGESFHGDGAIFVLHGINGIFDQIFQRPGYQISIDLDL